MKDDTILKVLDLVMLPMTENMLFYENEFMLVDNLELCFESDLVADYISANYPFKVNFTMMIFCTGGSMRVRLNLEEYCLESGKVLVVLPNAIGQCLGISPDCKLAVIAFSNERYVDVANLNFVIRFRNYLSKQPVLGVTPEEMDESLSIYRAMRRKMSQPGFCYVREALAGYMQVLASNGYQWISRNEEQQDVNLKENRQQLLFSRFLELVQQLFRESRSISYYAEKLCITPKYLSSVVHQVSGRYAGEWICDYVILEAKALLKSKEYTVQQVGDMLGFSNASFFGKYFKAAVGCSPRKYMLG